jgi:hypothetical protein
MNSIITFYCQIEPDIEFLSCIQKKYKEQYLHVLQKRIGTIIEDGYL